MTEILAATVPIFLIVAVGYAFTRWGPLRREDMAVLSIYVVKLGLPTLIFVAVSGRELREIFNVTYLLVYAVAAWIMMAVGRLYGRWRGLPPMRGVFIAFAMSGTNNGFVGFPIFLLLLPEAAGLAIGMDMLVDNTVLIPVILAMVSAAAHTEGGWGRRVLDTLRHVLTHPMVIAIILALLLKAAGLTLPPILSRSVALLAQSASGVALFTVGGLLVGLRLSGQIADIAVAVAGKLVGQPAVAVLLVAGFGFAGLPALSHDLRAAAILTCALPMMSIMPPLAEEHGHGDLGAAAMMLSTVGSFVTLTLWMFGLHAVGWL